MKNLFIKILPIILLIYFNSCSNISKSKKSKTNPIENITKSVFEDIDKKEEKEEIDQIIFEINTSYKIIVESNKLSLLKSDKKLFENSKIIRLKDQNSNCMSEGFQKIISNSDFFTIEQQNCSNKYLINEYITFEYNEKEDDFFLSKIRYTYRNKFNPDIKKEKKIYNKNDFGIISIKDLNIYTLYVKMVNN